MLLIGNVLESTLPRRQLSYTTWKSSFQKTFPLPTTIWLGKWSKYLKFSFSNSLRCWNFLLNTYHCQDLIRMQMAFNISTDKKSCSYRFNRLKCPHHAYLMQKLSKRASLSVLSFLETVQSQDFWIFTLRYYMMRRMVKFGMQQRHLTMGVSLSNAQP